MRTFGVIMLCVFSSAFADDPEELRLADEMTAIFAKNKEAMFRGDRKETIAEGMEEMSDAERTQMIAAYLFHKTGENPLSDRSTISLLNAFPNTIQDDAELRKLLSTETDARRFHVLRISLADRMTSHHGSTFIVEMAHMLLRNERVGRWKYHDDSLMSDVSQGTYIDISADLKRLNAPFEAPPEDIPHEQRKLILARWLKENWPGCENLELPGVGRAGASGQARSEFPAPPIASTAGPGDGGGKEDPRKSPPRWAWVSAFVLLAASFVAWLRSRPGKMES